MHTHKSCHLFKALMRRRLTSRNFLLFLELEPNPYSKSNVRRNFVTISKSENKSLIPENERDLSLLIRKYALMPQTSVSLQNLMQTGQGEFVHFFKADTIPTASEDEKEETKNKILLQVANFLPRELAIRLAHRIQDLDNSHYFCDMPSVKQVREVCVQSFCAFLAFQSIKDMEQEKEFAHVLQTEYDRHSNGLIQMARGAYELREAIRTGSIDIAKALGDSMEKGVVRFEQMNASHAFLDRFYTTRIGIRVLIGQYLALRQPLSSPGYVGLIDLYTSPYNIVQRAADDASLICCRKYGDSPRVNIAGRLDLTFPYIPTHLHYIAFELIKNSMRATVDFHGVDNNLPPVDVIIADGKENEDVVIKVEDKGGGIPRSDIPKIWSYLFTTADPVIQEGLVAFSSKQGDHSTDSPLAGLGYGLPISRSYARYFGGDLNVMSMEGYGTDAFIYLRRLGDSKEPLPV